MTMTPHEAGPIGHVSEESVSTSEWWRSAVVYAVYPTSFADSDNDGVGDLNGLRARLDHITALGADAIWLCPWNPSPMVDGGYDVTDYCDVNPTLGTLEDARALVDQVHRSGMRVIIDLVANHTSDQHPWFLAALAAEPESVERERYIFRDGRGDEGELPPNNWISAFGSSAWTRVVDGQGVPGQWYLHTFAPEQPDLNWSSETVRSDFDGIIRFWFDFGIDGLRIDAAPAMAKISGLPDFDYEAYGDPDVFASSDWVDSPHWDTPGVHEVLRRFRRISDSYDGDRMFVAEAVVSSSERLTRYLRPDELHTAFNFQFLKAPFGPGLRSAIQDTLESHATVEAPPTWCLSSHDEVRLATRLGRSDTAAIHLVDPARSESDLVLGRRRARAAMLLMLALPGSAYIYQGEELGLPFVGDLPEDRLRDPIFARSGGQTRGRDGSRVPMPWTPQAPNFGFTSPEREPWLPMPADWTGLSVQSQSQDPRSMLWLIRRALSVRSETFTDHALTWSTSDPDVLDFQRGANSRCILNLSPRDLDLDPGWEVTLASEPLPSGQQLPTDTTVWLRRR